MPRKVAAFHKAIGVPFDAGWLHDLTLPRVSTRRPRRPPIRSLTCPCWTSSRGRPRPSTPPHGHRWIRRGRLPCCGSTPCTVKTTPADVADEILQEAHKAFRDANPGPGSAPVPGEIPAERFRRPYITDGHAAPSSRPGPAAPRPGPCRARLRVHVPARPARERPRGGLARQHEPAPRAHRRARSPRRPVPRVLHQDAAGQRPAGHDRHARPHRPDLPRRVPHARAGAHGPARRGNAAGPGWCRGPGAARGQQGR